MNVVNLPEHHSYSLCKDCGCGSWFLCWPNLDKQDTYIKCSGCDAEFNLKFDLDKKAKK